VRVVEAVRRGRLNTPSRVSLGAARAHRGPAHAVTIANRPAFCAELDAHVEVPSVGRVRYDMAYGGNFYAIVPIAELALSFDQKDRMMSAGLAIMDAINEQRRPRHPVEPDIAGCKHVVLVAP